MSIYLSPRQSQLFAAWWSKLVLDWGYLIWLLTFTNLHSFKKWFCECSHVMLLKQWNTPAPFTHVLCSSYPHLDRASPRAFSWHDRYWENIFEKSRTCVSLILFHLSKFEYISNPGNTMVRFFLLLPFIPSLPNHRFGVPTGRPIYQGQLWVAFVSCGLRSGCGLNKHKGAAGRADGDNVGGGHTVQW